jgi:hypothetical protein
MSWKWRNWVQSVSDSLICVGKLRSSANQKRPCEGECRSFPFAYNGDEVRHSCCFSKHGIRHGLLRLVLLDGADIAGLVFDVPYVCGKGGVSHNTGSGRKSTEMECIEGRPLPTFRIHVTRQANCELKKWQSVLPTSSSLANLK